MCVRYNSNFYLWFIPAYLNRFNYNLNLCINQITPYVLDAECALGDHSWVIRKDFLSQQKFFKIKVVYEKKKTNKQNSK